MVGRRCWGNGRLSPTDRQALTLAFNAGVSQARLAAEYGIRIRSVKRLVQGVSNRPQAGANRLTAVQRGDLIHAYRTTSSTQHELARKYGISLSSVKRLLRHQSTNEWNPAKPALPTLTSRRTRAG